MIVVVRCPCGETVKWDHADAILFLKMPWRASSPRSIYAYGDHVTDPRAFVMRQLNRQGWRYEGARLGKSTLKMRCPACIDPAGPTLLAEDGSVILAP